MLGSRVGSAGCSIEPLLGAHTQTDVFLSTDAQSAGEQTMAEGTVQRRLEALDHELIQVTGGPPGNTFYHV